MAVSDPAPKFERFERIVVESDTAHSREFIGAHGTILWRDFVRGNASRPDRWVYVVTIPARGICRTFFEADLKSEGIFDAAAVHLGKRAEMSFDVVMEPDMDVIEGTYRRPGRFWQVAVFTKHDVPSLRYRPSSWPNGMTGILFRVPRTVELNRDYARWAMSRAFGHPEWIEVQGPDSMMLR
jgi:hypothetical protein